MKNRYQFLVRVNTLFLLFFLFLSHSVPAQDLRFEHHGVDDGLAQTVILCIYEDSEGLLWFGTQSGLSLFDGYKFVNFYTDPTNSSSISNTWIYDITEDSEGNLYLGTKGGLDKFDKKTGQFSSILGSDKDNLDNQRFIYGLASQDSILYINTPPGVTILNTLNGKSTFFRNDFPESGTVYDIGLPILLSDNGLVWIGTPNGLSNFNPDTKNFTNYDLSELPGGSSGSNSINCLYKEKNGDILAGTRDGIFLIDSNTLKIRRLTSLEPELSSLFVRDILRGGNNTLWVATEGGGLNYINLSTGYTPVESIHYRYSQNFVSHDIIYKLFIDKSGNLWIGTIAGLDKCDLKKSGIEIITNTGDPSSYNLLDVIIASIYQDKNGRLWIGNWGSGLNILNPQGDRRNILHYTTSSEGKFHLPENHVHIIFQDSRGRIFIGTRGGVSVYREGTQEFSPVHEYFSNPEYDCFNNIRVYCMMEDLKGRIWIGTGYGIIILDIENNSMRTLRADGPDGWKINSNLVYSIIQDDRGEIWIAGSEGINIYNPKNNTIQSMRRVPGSSNTLCNNFTVSLCQDTLGYIWIGTGSGLNRYSRDDSTFIYYSRSDGLPSEIFYDIIEDNSGKIWFTTGRGLVSIDPWKAEEKRIQIIDQLKGEEFNLKAVYKARDGKLYFGGMNGVFSFYPDSLTQNNYIPPVRVTSIQKENRGKLTSLNPWQSNIDLTYRDYGFTIEFAALDYTSPQKNRYAYKMEGLSDSWFDLGERHFVHFTNLPSGSYTFLVKGTNSDGIWNEIPTELKIHISPPWWASNYAFIAYFILLVILIICIIYIRESNLRSEKRKLEKEVKRRTIELAAQKQFAEESEQKLRSTIQSLDDIMVVIDEKGRLQEIYNPGKRKTHFIFPELHIGKHFSEINFPEDVMDQFKKAFQNKGNDTGIIEFDHHFVDEGSIFWYNTKISPKKNAEGILTGLVVVARDITDRKHSEEVLAKQKEELYELNVAKDKFFSILAHDLKNPFTNLYSLGEILVKNYHLLDEEDKMEALKKIHRSSVFIYELLENLYTWSRSQRGKIIFQPDEFDLYKIAEVNANLYRPQAETKGISILNEVTENSHAYGDREMINTVVRNLLNNAVKFSHSGGKVIIRAEKNKDHYVVSIKDEGVGIPKEDQKRLFRLDEKYKTTGTAGETGTGLGLILCKEFIQKHGKDIWCDSEPGKGTVFSFGLGMAKKNSRK